MGYDGLSGEGCTVCLKWRSKTITISFFLFFICMFIYNIHLVIQIRSAYQLPLPVCLRLSQPFSSVEAFPLSTSVMTKIYSTI